MGLHAQIDAAQTAIAALTPADVSGGAAAFSVSVGDIGIDADAPVLDRSFDVGLDDSGGESGPQWGTAYAQRGDRMVVVVRYDARRDLTACDRRIAQDTDQIVTALEAASARAADTQLVTWTARSIDRAAADFPVLRLTFDVLYQTAL